MERVHGIILATCVMIFINCATLAAVAKLKQLNNRRIMKIVLLAWRETAEQSAKTNKWFKVCANTYTYKN